MEAEFIRRQWGLAHVPSKHPRAQKLEQLWRWPILFALLATTPAFYLEMLGTASPWVPEALYALAALVCGLSLWHIGVSTGSLRQHVRANRFELVLIAGLLLAVAMPASADSSTALAIRLLLAFVMVVRMVWMFQHRLASRDLVYVLALAVTVLAMCGLGFWWLEPRAQTFGDGLWLAFTTAATVGYGDIVPSTPASKIFAVFVVLLGYAVLTLVTASIAAMWVETQERRIEHEILRDMHAQLSHLRGEVAQIQRLREDIQRVREEILTRTNPAAASRDSDAQPGQPL